MSTYDGHNSNINCKETDHKGTEHKGMKCEVLNKRNEKAQFKTTNAKRITINPIFELDDYNSLLSLSAEKRSLNSD